jgi:predicted nuclease with TOPRIM domain
VIFNQMRRDPVEVEHTMRLELAEAARRVRRELDSSVVEFGYFRRTAQQSAADSFSHMTEHFDEIVAKLLASLEAVTAKLSMPLEEAARQLGDATGEATRTMGAALAANAGQLSAETEKLSSRVGAVAVALDDVVAKLQSMQTPDRVFAAHLEPMLQFLAQAIDRIGAHSDAQAKSVTDALAISNTAAERSIDLVSAMRQDFDTTSSANRAMLEWASAMIKATAEVLDEIKTGSQVYTEGLTFILEKADETMRTLTEVLVQSGEEQTVRTERLNEALPALESRARTLTIAADRIAGIVEELRGRQKRLEREVIE